MKPRFRRVKDGDTIDVYPINRWACCDCGLVHTMSFKPVGRTGLQVTVRRNELWTKASRQRKSHPYVREAANDER